MCVTLTRTSLAAAPFASVTTTLSADDVFCASALLKDKTADNATTEHKTCKYLMLKNFFTTLP